MFFYAVCDIDNGATWFHRTCIVKADTIEEARRALHRHYEKGHDDICFVRYIYPYEIKDRDVFEVSRVLGR